MEAMTMDYKLKDPSIASELHPGDRITAKILADGDSSMRLHNVRLDDIVVIAQARPDYKPPVSYHVPHAGRSGPQLQAPQSERTHYSARFSFAAKSFFSPSSIPAASSPISARA